MAVCLNLLQPKGGYETEKMIVRDSRCLLKIRTV